MLAKELQEVVFLYLKRQSLANYLFARIKEVRQTVIPNSGFTIRYIYKVFKSNGTLIKEYGKIGVEVGTYSILEVQKNPNKVKVHELESKAGIRGAKVIRWKIKKINNLSFPFIS